MAMHTVIHTLPRAIVCLLFVLSPFHPCVAAQSAEQREAAIGFMNYQKQVQGAMNQCAMQFAGRGGELFTFLEQFWSGGNLPMALASEQVLAAAPESERQGAMKSTSAEALSFMAPFDRADAREKHQLCETLSAKARGGKLDHANVAPTDARILLAIFSANDHWRNAKRNADFTIGCMKQQWNAGNHDISVVKPACECQTAVLVRSASDQELDDWQKRMSANRGNEAAVVESTPWFMAALPAMRACKSKN